MKSESGREARANYSLLTVHLFQASSALLMYLLHQVQAKDLISHELNKDITDALIYLEAHPSGQSRQAMAVQAIDVLHKLRSELRARVNGSAEERSSSNETSSNLNSTSSGNESQPVTSRQPSYSHQHIRPSATQGQQPPHIPTYLRSRSTTGSDDPLHQDEKNALYSPPLHLVPQGNNHVRAATWQVGHPPDYPYSPSATNSPHAQYHSPQPQLPPVSHPRSQYLAGGAGRLNSISTSNPPSNSHVDSSEPQLPFDLDAYLQATFPGTGDRGDRVFQALDGLLTASPLGDALPNPSGFGTGAQPLGNNLPSLQEPGFVGPANQGFHSFPTPPQANPLPSYIPHHSSHHLGGSNRLRNGITTMQHPQTSNSNHWESQNQWSSQSYPRSHQSNHQ